MQPWKKLTSHLILDTRYFKVRQDTVELPTGEHKEWTYWESADSAMVAGRVADGRFVLIRQYRYLVGGDVLEFPSGGLHAGEAPEVGARREFEEETGYTCNGPLLPLGAFYETYGQLNRRIHLFLADVEPGNGQQLDQADQGYEDIQVELYELETILQLIAAGKIVALGSALTAHLAKNRSR